MKKFAKVLVLAGLVTSLLAGCDLNNDATPSSSSANSSGISSSSEIVKALSGIEIASNPTKTGYKVGEQFDATGLAVKAVYNTGEKEDLAATDYQLSGFSMNQAGEQTVTVSYQQQTATFKINVYGKKSVAIKAEPTKKGYKIGEAFDPAGLSVAQVYDDNSEVALTAEEYTISGYNPDQKGEQTITVTVGEQSATFKVNVYGVKAIAVKTQPTKKSYRAGEAFDPAGLSVAKVYDNDEEVLLKSDEYTISGYNAEQKGDQTITVTAGELTDTFTVNVIGRKSLYIKTAPKKVRYTVGEDLDLTGIEVYQVYDDDSEELLAADKYIASGYNKETVGPQEITISANDQTISFNVTVFAADWDTTTKANMVNANALQFEIPYFRGFRFGWSGFKNKAGQTLAQWGVAYTPYEASDDEFDEYLDAIEGIKVLVQDEDDNGDPKVDDQGQPVMVEQPAWSKYSVSGKKTTDDVKYLGFAADSDIYQYARWLNDNKSYLMYQVITIGLDDEGSLMVASTCAIQVFAGYGLGDGSSWRAIGTDGSDSFKAAQSLFSILQTYAIQFYYQGQAAVTDLSLSMIPFGDIKYPTYGTDTRVFVDTLNYQQPYIYGSAFSNLLDLTQITYEFINPADGTENNKAYAASDLATIQAAYEAANIKTYPTDQNGSFAVLLGEEAGFNWAIYYSFATHANSTGIVMDFKMLDYDVPFRGDFIVESIFDEISQPYYYVYTQQGLVPIANSQGQANFESPQVISYNEQYKCGLSANFYTALNPATAAGDVANAIKEAGWIAKASDLDWEQTYASDGSFQLGAEGQAASFRAIVTQPTNDIIQFQAKVGNNNLVAYYSISNRTLNVSIVNQGQLVPYAAFAAREGETDYTGTWTTGENEQQITIVLGGAYLYKLETQFLAENVDYSGSVVEVTIQYAGKLQDGTALYTVSFMCYDGINVPYDTWAEARAQLNGEITGEGATDVLPETLTHAEGATSFVVDGYYGGLLVVFETPEDAAASDLGADLVAGGFKKALNFTFNGVDWYASEHDQYYLGVSQVGDNLVFVEFSEDDPEDALDEEMTNLYYATGFDATNMDIAGAVALDVESNYAAGTGSLVVTFADAQAAAAKAQANIAILVAANYALDEDQESPTYGLYVSSDGNTGVRASLKDNVLTANLYWLGD